VAGELAGLGVTIGPATEHALAVYLRRVRQWSDRINLVSAADVERLGRRHLLESFNVLACPLPLSGGRLADAGSGAGLPGIPLALVKPELEVLLIESVRKKAAFLVRVASELGLGPPPGAVTSGSSGSDEAAPGAGDLQGAGGTAASAAPASATPAAAATPPRVIVAAERAELLAASPEHRARYGIVTVRGFGPLSRAVRECGDLVVPGGFLVAFKGSEPEREIREALGVMRARGFALTDIVPMRWGEGSLVLLRRKAEGECSS
jgi:16S rRNA G527 N7-methylase RsmG